MAVRAVIFDFDGVIVETEEPFYLAWREVWASFGQDLALSEWATCIGTGLGPGTFDPFRELARRTGLDLDETEVRARTRQLAERSLAKRALLPGVAGWLAEADAAGLPVGIASSSPRSWIDHHLARLGLATRFSVVACVDDCGVTKPDPAPYLLACQRLGIAPSEGLAVEDSLHGVKAAKSAGLACVAVPTAMTAHLDLGLADLVLSSLSEATLAATIERLRAWGY